MITFEKHNLIFKVDKTITPRDILVLIDGKQHPRNKYKFTPVPKFITNIQYEGNSVLCSDMFVSGNMYHIVCDHLARAWYFNRNVGGDVTYIFGNEMWKWSEWAVNLVLGDAKIRKVVMNNLPYRANNCYLASNVYRNLNQYPGSTDTDEYFQFLRDKMSQFNGDSPKKIYVSRRNSKRRSVVNERELEEKLQSKGYSSVVMENLAPSEQVSVFRGADVIVAPHGAALTNIVGCDPGKVIYELRDPEYTVRCYRPIVGMLELDFREIECINNQKYDINKIIEEVP